MTNNASAQQWKPQEVRMENENESPDECEKEILSFITSLNGVA